MRSAIEFHLPLPALQTRCKRAFSAPLQARQQLDDIAGQLASLRRHVKDCLLICAPLEEVKRSCSHKSA